MKNGMKTILLLCFLFFLMGGQVIQAEEIEDTELGDDDLLLMLEESGKNYQQEYHFPEAQLNTFMQAGFRLVDENEGHRALEYEYLKNSPLLHGLVHLFSHPHRQYLLFDVENEKDHFADFRYAYSDKFFMRWNNVAVFHNLGNSSPIDPSRAGYTVDPRDIGEEYGVKVERNNLFLRVKPREFPFHIYFGGERTSRKGDMQQRSALGGAIFSNIITTSQTRDVDWLTETYTIGTNSHAGPIEIDLSHKEKRFTARRDQFLVDSYGNSTLGPTTYRNAGDYPHNLLPDLRGSINTMKIHSSYTGRVVGSATFSHNARDNKTSGAESNAYTGSGSVHWLPRNNLSLNLKYLHRYLSVDNPSAVIMTDLTDPTDFKTYSPKASVSSEKNSLSLSSRYKPLPDLTLRAQYDYTKIKRTEADLWFLEDSSRYNTAMVSVRKKFAQNLTGDLKYRFKHIDSPSFNVEPDNAHEGDAKLTWQPHARINLLFNYKISRMKRDELHIDGVLPEPQNRNVRLDNFFVLGTFNLRNDLILSLSHARIGYEVEQDLQYKIPAQTLDPGITYKDDGRIYSAALHYTPLDNLQLSGEVTHVTSSGGFDPNHEDFLNPSIGSYSKQDIKETLYRLTGEYRLGNGLVPGFEYAYTRFDDVLDNIYDSEVDSKGHIIMLTLSKQW